MCVAAMGTSLQICPSQSPLSPRSPPPYCAAPGPSFSPTSTWAQACTSQGAFPLCTGNPRSETRADQHTKPGLSSDPQGHWLHGHAVWPPGPQPTAAPRRFVNSRERNEDTPRENRWPGGDRATGPCPWEGGTQSASSLPCLQQAWVGPQAAPGLAQTGPGPRRVLVGFSSTPAQTQATVGFFQPSTEVGQLLGGSSPPGSGTQGLSTHRGSNQQHVTCAGPWRDQATEGSGGGSLK